MSYTAIKITTDKEVSEVTIGPNTLSDLQACVGGWIESIELSDGSTMYVNEEGRIHSLPFNSIASDVCGLNHLTHHMLLGIVGDVVVVGPLTPDGTDTDVTNKQRRFIERVRREAVL